MLLFLTLWKLFVRICTVFPNRQNRIAMLFCNVNPKGLGLVVPKAS